MKGYGLSVSATYTDISMISVEGLVDVIKEMLQAFPDYGKFWFCYAPTIKIPCTAQKILNFQMAVAMKVCTLVLQLEKTSLQRYTVTC